MIAPKMVHALAEATPEGWGINDEDGRGRCIEAAKYALLLLRAERIECKAIACDAMAFNAVGFEWFTKGIPFVDWPPEAWSVGVVCEREVAADSKLEPGRKRGFGGHVIVVGDTWFLDLTAVQFHRPRKAIIVPEPVVGPYNPDAPPGWMLRDLAVGGKLMYRFRPEFKRWRTSHAWRHDTNREYLAAMREAMHRALPRLGE